VHPVGDFVGKGDIDVLEAGRLEPFLVFALRERSCDAADVRAALGALLAAAMLRGSLGNVAHVGATLPTGSQGQAFLWELILTFFLMFVIMAVATDTRAVGEAAAIAIGGTVGLDAMFGGPVTGASMNPARSLGPALVSGDLHALWLYILAPLLGAGLGAFIYQFVRGEHPRPAIAHSEEV
jgi:glycerol uptake facilitator-like aquaporin